MFGKRRDIMLVMVLMAILMALITSGCYPRTPEKRAERMVRHMARTLDLDEAQTAKLEKMKEEFLARRPDLTRMREETIHDLKDLMASPQLDRARLNMRTQKIQAQADDFILFVSTKLAELHDMLTPEQRVKLAEALDKHAGRTHHW